MKKIFLLTLLLLIAGCSNSEVEIEEENTLLEEYYSDKTEPEIVLVKDVKETKEELKENKKDEAEKLMKDVQEKLRNLKKRINENLNSSAAEIYDPVMDLYKQGKMDFEKGDYDSAVNYFNQAGGMSQS